MKELPTLGLLTICGENQLGEPVTETISIVQVRTHKKKRINKKCRKRYGWKQTNGIYTTVHSYNKKSPKADRVESVNYYYDVEEI